MPEKSPNRRAVPRIAAAAALVVAALIAGVAATGDYLDGDPPPPAARPHSHAGSSDHPPKPAVTGPTVAPYLYNGWADPPDAGEVMKATGIKAFTLAFVLDAGGCDPQWDGSRPLEGGVDAATIEEVTARGGKVVPSFGGAGGEKLESNCRDADALAGAYQKVIDAYGPAAIDIDIEAEAYDDPVVQQRTIDALKKIEAENEDLVTYVTFPSGRSGPDDSMVRRAAASGLEVDGWTIMPFNFGAEGRNMAELTIRATDALKDRVAEAYGYSEKEAYSHSGLSSMNGITDMKEKVAPADFERIAEYAADKGLARLAFWSVNRDRTCKGASPKSDTCSGLGRHAWQYTSIAARHQR